MRPASLISRGQAGSSAGLSSRLWPQTPAPTFLAIAPIKTAALETGYPLDQMWLLGALALICLVLYAIPTTSVLGAIILTGFLGRA
jgi:hypothetical protein